jgi:hypothetical protein
VQGVVLTIPCLTFPREIDNPGAIVSRMDPQSPAIYLKKLRFRNNKFFFIC